MLQQDIYANGWLKLYLVVSFINDMFTREDWTTLGNIKEEKTKVLFTIYNYV